MSTLCGCCGEQKFELHSVRSELDSGRLLYLCRMCASAGHEPRWLVILIGRSKGLEAIGRVLKKHRYHGEEISAKSLL